MSSKNEWPMVKLGEIAEIGTAQVKPESLDGETVYLGLEHLKKNGGILETSDVATAELKSSKYAFTEEAILFGKLRPNLRKIAVPNFSGVCSTDILPIYSSEKVNRSFLYHYLLSESPQAYIQNRVTGINLPRTSPKALRELQVPLPPLAEQQHIAEILDVTQRQFDLLKAKKTHLASLRTELVDQILEADDRETVLLKEIAEIQSGITKGRKARKGEILTETAYMAVSNVKDGHLDLETVKTIPATEADITRSRLKTGDVLLTEGGDPDKLGRGTVWRDEIEPCLHQNHIFRVRLPEDSRFTPEVLMAMLSTKQARAYFFRSAKQTTGIASINKTQLSAVPVPILTDSEIAKLSEALTQIDILSSYIEKRRIATESLHRALSTRAFAGQL